MHAIVDRLTAGSDTDRVRLYGISRFAAADLDLLSKLVELDASLTQSLDGMLRRIQELRGGDRSDRRLRSSAGGCGSR
jgi:hypothetical protein